MSLSLGLGVVLECCAIVQNPAVVDEQHFPCRKGELDPQAPLVRHAVKRVHG